MVNAERDNIVSRKKRAAGSEKEKIFKERYAQVETLSDLTDVVDDAISEGRRRMPGESLIDVYRETADLLPAIVPRKLQLLAAGGVQSTNQETRKQDQKRGTKAFICINLPMIFRHTTPEFTTNTADNEEYFQDVLIKVAEVAKNIVEERPIIYKILNAIRSAKKPEKQISHRDIVWGDSTDSPQIIAAIDDIAIDNALAVGIHLTQRDIQTAAAELAERTGYEYSELHTLTTRRAEEVYATWPRGGTPQKSIEESERTHKVDRALKEHTITMGEQFMIRVDHTIMSVLSENPTAPVVDIIDTLRQNQAFAAFTSEQLEATVILRMSVLSPYGEIEKTAAQVRKDVNDVITVLGEGTNPITRDEEIFRAYYGIDGKPETLMDLSVYFGISPERVRQILSKLSMKIRERNPDLKEYL